MDTPGSTWAERLLMNLFSYSLVLGPVAFVVLTTKYKLCPSLLQSSAIVQMFVYGHSDETSHRRSRPRDRSADNERLLIDDNISGNGVSGSRGRRLENKQQSLAPINRLKLLWCFLGLQLAYLIWGVLQEKIMTTKYQVPLDYQASEQTILVQLGTNKNLVNIKHLPGLSNNSFNYNNSTTNHHQSTIRFHDSQFLVFINRVTAFILAILALVFDRPKQSQPQSQFYSSKYIYYQHNSSSQSKSQAPLYVYVYCSLSNILSSWCQYEALKYVNFPTQVLSKSCKIVPVMLTSKLILHKSYRFSEYLCALLLSVGIFIFLFYQPVVISTRVHHSSSVTSHLNQNQTNALAGAAQNKQGSQLGDLNKYVTDNSLLSGLTILAFYLASDSFTSNWQQNLFTKYEVSNWQMMAATNFYSIMLTLTSLYQLGTLKPAIELLIVSRALLLDCILMSAMSSIGQLFVYYTIKQFGSVIFATIMTLRQFLAILLSCTIYGHQLTLGSSSGLLLVFTVVSFQVWHKSRQKHNPSGNKSTGNPINQEAQIQFKTSTS